MDLQEQLHSKREREIAAADSEQDYASPKRRRNNEDELNNNLLPPADGMVPPANDDPPAEAIAPLANPLLDDPFHNFPRSLALPTDPENMNLLHQKIRSCYLELFAVTMNDINNPRYAKQGSLFLGRIGLRCKFCAQAETENLHSGSSFFPRNIKSLYRSVCAWQRLHFKGCSFIGIDNKAEYAELERMSRYERSCTKYWESSAAEIGLVDNPGGIVYNTE